MHCEDLKERKLDKLSICLGLFYTKRLGIVFIVHLYLHFFCVVFFF